MKLTSTELIVLGLVAEQPRHGYDLEQVIERRGIRYWAEIGFSSIYYVLAKLEDRGLIKSNGDQPGAKTKRVFRATTAGRSAAARAAAASIADQRTVVHPMLAGLANAQLISDDDYGDALQQRMIWISERIAAVLTAEQEQAPLPHPAHEVFSYSLSLLEAERSWLAARVGVPDD